MRRRIILSGIFSFLALSGAVRPAQAGEFAYGCGHWGYFAPCVPFGLFFYGSRLGLGTGFPGLRPYPGWHHPSCARIFPCPLTAVTTIELIPERKVRIKVKGPERQVVQEVRAPEPSGTQESTRYSSIVERARRLYPNGLPPIESVWHPDGTVQKLNNR